MTKNKKTGLKNYKDLKIWKKAHDLAMEVFKLFQQAQKTGATYEIWKQCLKAAFSVPANIVEGFYSHKGANFIAKLNIAKGEAGETEYWTFVLSETNDISKEKYQRFSQGYLEVILMLKSMIEKIGGKTKK